MRSVTIVGGGIAGLVAALTLREGFKVTLVEKEPDCGGLLKSITGKTGARFDYGTHVLSETGDSQLDALLFGGVSAAGWNRFQVIRSGTFFRGKLHAQSGFIDARDIPGAAAEILSTRPFEGARSLAEFSLNHFGSVLTEQVARPQMKKQFAVPLEDLQPDNPFFMRRVVAFEPERTRELKKDPFFDAKLAFNSNAEGVGAKVHYYPKGGGVGAWVDLIVADLAKSGVEVLTGRSAASVSARGIVLDDGRALAHDRLVWTIPPSMLLKSLGLDSTGGPPPTTPVTLFHFVFDKPFLADNHYIACYDEDLKTYRVTLYPNLRGDGAAPHNCTVEVIGEASEAEVRAELSALGLVAEDAQTLCVDSARLPAGFPALTPAFTEATLAQLRRVPDGITLLGRAKLTPFFMDAVMIESFQKSRELLRWNTATISKA